MRMRGHAEHDDARYVPPELLEEWRGKDPITRFVALLGERGLIGSQVFLKGYWNSSPLR